MTQFLRLLIEELVRQSDLDSRQAQHLKIYIDDADNHPEFKGYDLVKGPERDSSRLAILDDLGNVVGFMTPRLDRGYWRTGAIYVDPGLRGKGFAKKAIIEFFSNPNHRPAKVWIAEQNKESQRAFQGAGFVRGNRRDLSPAPEDRGHDYFLE